MNGAYFERLSAALSAAGIAEPVLVVDRDRLDANIAALMDDLPAGMGYRIVAKSLPSLPLIRHVREKTGTDRLMTFNLAMLSAIAREMPDADQLLGKPMPVAAARKFYASAPADAKVQWLVDTPERLAQYIALAEETGTAMRLCLEVNVGLHRGGFAADAVLARAVETIRASNRVSLSGLMGYEPHVAKMPPGKLRETALHSAWDIFGAAKETAGITTVSPTFNMAGSPTYRLYQDTSLANEVSVGSVLVKPTDFDTDLLEAHRPASFIATPALKVLDGVNVAGFEFVPGREPEVPEGHAKTVYTFGGNWMAEPVWPEGLEVNRKYGRSSNQQMLTGPADVAVRADDFVYFRPTQSEAVFLQFGALAVYSGGGIAGWWDVFPASA